MRSRFLRAKLITGTIVAALAFAQTLPMPPASASDWVDDNDVSEFSLPRQDENDHPAQSASDRPNNQSQRQNNQGQANNSDDAENNSDDRNTTGRREYVPPADAVVKDVSDTGGIELGPDGKPRKTRAPLEASISTTRPGFSDGDGNGMDRRAEQLLARSPMLATPKQINADPKAFKAWLTATHPGVLENATRDQIIEIKGEWDDASHVLRTFGLPHTRITAKKFSEVDLRRVKIVVVNCEGHLPNEAILSLRNYVAMGGYLLTTDWALQNVVERAFPRTVKWYEGYYTSDSSNRIVPAVIVGEDKSLTAGCPPIGHWQLVKKSQIAQVVNPTNVQVLARTRLMTEDPEGLGILAVVIGHGTGKILHLVGHFDNNIEMALNSALPDPAPGLGLSLRQALAANFISEALQHGEPDATQATTKK